MAEPQKKQQVKSIFSGGVVDITDTEQVQAPTSGDIFAGEVVDIDPVEPIIAGSVFDPAAEIVPLEIEPVITPAVSTLAPVFPPDPIVPDTTVAGEFKTVSENILGSLVENQQTNERKILSTPAFIANKLLEGLTFGVFNDMEIGAVPAVIGSAIGGKGVNLFKLLGKTKKEDPFITLRDIEPESLIGAGLGEVAHFAGLVTGIGKIGKAVSPIGTGILNRYNGSKLGKVASEFISKSYDSIGQLVTKDLSKRAASKVIAKEIFKDIAKVGGTVGLLSSSSDLSALFNQEDDKFTTWLSDFGTGAAFGAMFPISGPVIPSVALRTIGGMAAFDVVKSYMSRDPEKPLTPADFTSIDDFIATANEVMGSGTADTLTPSQIAARKQFAGQLFGYLMDGYFLATSKPYRKEFRQTYGKQKAVDVNDNIERLAKKNIDDNKNLQDKTINDLAQREIAKQAQESNIQKELNINLETTDIQSVSAERLRNAGLTDPEAKSIKIEKDRGTEIMTEIGLKPSDPAFTRQYTSKEIKSQITTLTELGMPVEDAISLTSAQRASVIQSKQAEISKLTDTSTEREAVKLEKARKQVISRSTLEGKDLDSFINELKKPSTFKELQEAIRTFYDVAEVFDNLEVKSEVTANPKVVQKADNVQQAIDAQRMQEINTAKEALTVKSEAVDTQIKNELSELSESGEIATGDSPRLDGLLEQRRILTKDKSNLEAEESRIISGTQSINSMFDVSVGSAISSAAEQSELILNTVNEVKNKVKEATVSPAEETRSPEEIIKSVETSIETITHANKLLVGEGLSGEARDQLLTMRENAISDLITIQGDDALIRILKDNGFSEKQINGPDGVLTKVADAANSAEVVNEILKGIKYDNEGNRLPASPTELKEVELKAGEADMEAIGDAHAAKLNELTLKDPTIDPTAEVNFDTDVLYTRPSPESELSKIEPAKLADQVETTEKTDMRKSLIDNTQKWGQEYLRVVDFTANEANRLQILADKKTLRTEKEAVKAKTLTLNNIIREAKLREQGLSLKEARAKAKEIRQVLINNGIILKSGKIKFSGETLAEKEFVADIIKERESVSEENVIEFKNAEDAIDQINKRIIKTDDVLFEFNQLKEAESTKNTGDFNELMKLTSEDLNIIINSGNKFIKDTPGGSPKVRRQLSTLQRLLDRLTKVNTQFLEDQSGFILIDDLFNPVKSFRKARGLDPETGLKKLGNLDAKVTEDKGVKFMQNNAIRAQKKFSDLTETDKFISNKKFTGFKARMGKNLIDQSGAVKNWLKSQGETGELAKLRLIAIKGSSGKSAQQLERAQRAILDGINADGVKIHEPLNVQESYLLRKFVFMKRTERILKNEQRKAERRGEKVKLKDVPRVIAGGLKPNEVIQWNRMFKIEHPDLNKKLSSASDAYFNEFRDMLLDLEREGLLSSARVKRLMDEGDYSPTTFLKAQEEYLSSAFSNRLLQAPKSIIKTLQQGNSQTFLETDIFSLLGIALNRHNRAIATNTANKQLLKLAREGGEGIKDMLREVAFERKDPTKKIMAEVAELEKKVADNPTKENKVKLRVKKNKLEDAVIASEINGRLKDFEPNLENTTTIRVFESGEEFRLFMTDELAVFWTGTDPLIQPHVLNAISKWSGTELTKATATGVNPLFAVKNILKDAQSIYSRQNEYSTNPFKYSFQIGKDLADVAKDAWTLSGKWEDYIDEGGGMEWLALRGDIGSGDPTRAIASLKQERKFRKPTILKSESLKDLEQIVRRFNTSAEAWTRLALRERYIKNHINDTGKGLEQIQFEATMAARDYLDFSQGGSWSKMGEAGIPYLNASIQGTRGLFKFAKSNPKEFAIKMGWLMGLEATLFSAIQAIAPDTWNDISDNDKKRKWILPLGNAFLEDDDGGKHYAYLTIPKDQDQIVIGQLAQTLMGMAYGQSEEDLTLGVDDVGGLIADILPLNISGVTPSLAAAFSYMANYDFFRESQIFKGNRDTFDWAELNQDDHPMTRVFGKALASVADGAGIDLLSPVRIEHGVSKILNTQGNPISGFAADGLKFLMDAVGESGREPATKAMLGDAFGISRELDNASFMRRMSASHTGFLGVKWTNPNQKVAERTRKAEKTVNTGKVQLSAQLKTIEDLAFREPTEANIATVKSAYLDAIKNKKLTIRTGTDGFKEFTYMITKIPAKSDRDFWRSIRFASTPEAQAMSLYGNLIERDKSDPEQAARLRQQMGFTVSKNTIAHLRKLEAANK